MRIEFPVNHDVVLPTAHVNILLQNGLRVFILFLPHSCRGIVFTHSVQMAGGLAVGKSLSGLYLRNLKV